MALSIFRGNTLALDRPGPSGFNGVGPVGDQLRGADLQVTASLLTKAAQFLVPSFHKPEAQTAQSRKTALIA